MNYFTFTSCGADGLGADGVRSRDYQNFSDAYITIINQITVKPIKTKAQEGMIHDAHKKTAWRTDPFYKFRQIFFLILFSNDTSVLQFLIVDDNVA